MTGRSAPTFEQAQAVLAAQPFSRLVGATLTEFGDGRACLGIALRPDHLQQNGVAHGGLVAYLADNAITFAAGSALGPHVLTASMSIDYVLPARGEELRAQAWVVHAGERRAVSHCEVHVRAGGSWSTVAVAQGSVRTSSA